MYRIEVPAQNDTLSVRRTSPEPHITGAVSGGEAAPYVLRYVRVGWFEQLAELMPSRRLRCVRRGRMGADGIPQRCGRQHRQR